MSIIEKHLFKSLNQKNLFETNPVIAVAVSGGPDSIALVFLLKNTNKFAFLSFALIGLATIIRFEGIILLPAFSIVYFLYQKDKKKKIPLYFCLILIFVMILLPTSVLFNGVLGKKSTKCSLTPIGPTPGPPPP